MIVAAACHLVWAFRKLLRMIHGKMFVVLNITTFGYINILRRSALSLRTYAISLRDFECLYRRVTPRQSCFAEVHVACRQMDTV